MALFQFQCVPMLCLPCLFDSTEQIQLLHLTKQMCVVLLSYVPNYFTALIRM